MCGLCMLPRFVFTEDVPAFSRELLVDYPLEEALGGACTPWQTAIVILGACVQAPPDSLGDFEHSGTLNADCHV